MHFKEQSKTCQTDISVTPYRWKTLQPVLQILSRRLQTAGLQDSPPTHNTRREEGREGREGWEDRKILCRRLGVLWRMETLLAIKRSLKRLFPLVLELLGTMRRQEELLRATKTSMMWGSKVGGLAMKTWSPGRGLKMLQKSRMLGLTLPKVAVTSLLSPVVPEVRMR